MTRQTDFQLLFDAYYGAVKRYLLSRGHQSADADDLVAATFEVTWRQLDRVPSGREAMPWLLAVARNLSRNTQRKARRELTLLSDLSRAPRTGPDQEVLRLAEAPRVLQALAELKALDRELLLLVAWHELTPTEAGEVLGLRAGTARSRLHRARQRLSALLADTAPSDSPDLSTSPFSASIIDSGDAHDA
jgi:RNA polymerase sigma factor (sigma-70 family)